MKKREVGLMILAGLLLNSCGTTETPDALGYTRCNGLHSNRTPQKQLV